MKLKLTATLLALLLFTSCIRIYNQPDLQTGRLTLSSSAELLVVPDEVSLSFGIEKYDTSVKRAREQTKKVLDALVKALIEQKINEKDIEYGQISITPKHAPYTSNSQANHTIVGYTTYLSIQVKLQDFDRISEVVDLAVGQGVNTVGSFNFYSTKMPEHKKRVRSMAIKAALAKARQYEKEMGLTLGKLLTVRENASAYHDRSMSNVVQSAEAMPFDSESSISPGEIPLRLYINCEYEIVK